jgi:hypothetical protein
MRNMADWCAERGLHVYIVDNNSDYPPLLKYYEKCPHDVIPLNRNFGHKVVWDLALVQNFGITGRYIVSDPDLDLTGIPDDFLDVMHRGLDKYSRFNKIGFSLEINDLPNSKEGNFIRDHAEAYYWTRPLDSLYFDAPTDTTFAMYREGHYNYFHPAIRTNRPYTAKHVPWYYLDFESLSEEERYYFKSASDSSSGKTRLLS